MTATRLSCENLGHGFGTAMVFKDLYLEIRTGTTLGILGPNGSGKTTLFKCITGALRPLEGSRFIDGVLVETLMPWRQVACLPQTSMLPQSWQVRDALAFFKAQDLATDSFIAPLAGARVSSLSPGSLRYLECRLVIALARPFTLLDEPFSEIDPIMVTRLHEIIGEAAQTGAIVMTDHLHHEVRKSAQTLMVLAHGRLETCNGTDADLRRLGYYPPLTLQGTAGGTTL